MNNYSNIFWNNIVADNLELESINRINNGEILEVLRSATFTDLFIQTDKGNLIRSWKSIIEEHAEKCDTDEMKAEFLSLGIASLLVFVQQNWTGPNASISDLPLLNYEDESVLKNQRLGVCEELVMDGENIVSVVQFPELLLISRLIIKKCYDNFRLNISPYWHLRAMFVHQQVLEESSQKLFDELNNVMNEIRSSLADCKNVDLTELYLEFARIHLYYNHVQKSKCDVEKALECSRIQTSLIGALGKRTKFQQEDLAQLTLRVEVGENVGHDDSEATLPVDVKLEDEVQLNKIKFKNQEDGEHPNLTGLHQAIILAVFCQTQKSQPKDRLADEELQPLISCILDNPKVWAIKLTTLLFRSRLESNHKRSVERAMMQIQNLVDNIDSDKPSLKERLQYFFICHQPPRWEIGASLAKIMMCMGAFKSALDIYLKLEDWESVIHCYTVLEMRHKAQEIIEQELKKNETPKLWCYLGDVTEDFTHYETAWKLSNERSARAQRHWAMFHYNRREYDKSIKHFELSLEKNSLQSELWYRLGYAALHEENWEVSANAYRRYCVLDPECFEAWNNLARCYCELKQKRRAWRSLQEALKVDYSNWRVWDNYMLVSADLREFDEVVRSYHQVLNLKEKHVDVPVLTVLVGGFKEAEAEVVRTESSDEKEAGMKDLKKFREKMLTLFGRLTSQVVGQAELWRLYAEVVPSESRQDRLKRQQLLLKAYNATVNNKAWVKTLESCREVVDLASELIDASLSAGERGVIASCRMSVRGCLTMIRKEHPGSDLSDQLEGKLAILEKVSGDA